MSAVQAQKNKKTNKKKETTKEPKKTKEQKKTNEPKKKGPNKTQEPKKRKHVSTTSLMSGLVAKSFFFVLFFVFSFFGSRINLD